jgi:AraC-like DNA-binding protein
MTGGAWGGYNVGEQADRTGRRTEVAADELARLAEAIERRTGADGAYDTAVSALKLSRFSAPTELTSLVYEPCLCVVASGAKDVLLAGETYRLDPAQSLLVSVELPVAARVAEASARSPYLAARISLDTAVVGEFLVEGVGAPPGPTERGLGVTPVGKELLDAVYRLVALLDSRQEVAALAPLVLREITYRVLAGPQGARLRQIASAGAPAQRIAKAVRWLKDNFSEPVSVESLARRAGLSLSAFHLHFKGVTAMSPLQYQKRLRLQEARRLMLGEGLDAAEAAFRVGYESPSQFSREYRREFGAPPRRDVAALKAEAQPAT